MSMTIIYKLLLSLANYIKQCYINIFLSRPRLESLFIILMISLLGYFFIGLIFSGLNLLAIVLNTYSDDISYCWVMSKYSLYGIIGLTSSFFIIGKLVKR